MTAALSRRVMFKARNLSDAFVAFSLHTPQLFPALLGSPRSSCKSIVLTLNYQNTRDVLERLINFKVEFACFIFFCFVI